MTSTERTESPVMTPEEMKDFFSMTPFFVKWIYKWKAKPAFDKMVSVI
jgi:hypothetical protein